MATVRFFGNSDDLIEIEGDIPGCGEYEDWMAKEHEFAIEDQGQVAMSVFLSYADDGVWRIRCTDERRWPCQLYTPDAKMSTGDFFAAAGFPADHFIRRSGQDPYTMVLSIEVPKTAKIIDRAPKDDEG